MPRAQSSRIEAFQIHGTAYRSLALTTLGMRHDHKKLALQAVLL